MSMEKFYAELTLKCLLRIVLEISVYSHLCVTHQMEEVCAVAIPMLDNNSKKSKTLALQFWWFGNAHMHNLHWFFFYVILLFGWHSI